MIITQNAGRAHAWNVVNHNGQIVYADPQTGQSSTTPLHSGTNGVFAILLDANRRPIATTRQPAVHGNTHRVGPYATRFDEPEDMVRADQYLRDRVINDGEPPDAEVPIADIFGGEGHERFTGFYRDPSNLNEFLPVDFEGGTIKPVYRFVDGNWKLVTMYANPAPGRHP